MNFLDIIFPKRCVGCGCIGRYFCDSCKKSIRPIANNESVCAMCGRPALDGITHPRCHEKFGIDRLTCFFHYDGVIKQAIKTIKYRYVRDLATELISLIDTSVVPHGTVIPIPLHSSRYRERGFNQAEILARQFKVPIRTDILVRKKPTNPQAEIQKKEERFKNMQHVFSINNDALTRCRIDAVILFDDVFTTGATMRAAAGVLKRHGVQSVWGVTIAR